ncbi:unnamed protein product [Protopolystoma xenopodis]|uniref:Uncharacterized protein n=1 Tax=Protopolystoma xenopodis TaxID=117903 RepID=A0A3S5B8X7_9PLAT|nr:unnamed protein product [Protopolystoma xenopodis]
MVGGGFLDSIGHADIILSRWCLSLELFGHFFADDVGAEHRSYILELAGFPTREARFRKEMERLRNASRGDLTLEVGRERGLLIINTIKQLNCEYVKRLDQSNCGLASHFATGLLPSASAASLLGPSSPTSTADSHSRPQPHQLHQHNQAFMRSETNLTDSLLTAASATAGYNGLIDYINQDGTCYIQPQSQGIGHSAAQLPTNQHLREPLVRQTSTVAATTALSLAGSSLQPLLACHRVKVTFRDEPGEGNGVARSFFTAFAEALLVSDELPSLNSVLGFSNTISVNGISPSVATPPPPPIGSICKSLVF